MYLEMNKTPQFLMLPFEIRRQILLETIATEIQNSNLEDLDQKPSTEAIFVHIVTRISSLPNSHPSVCQVPKFWGREPMTRLMRTNRQIY